MISFRKKWLVTACLVQLLIYSEGANALESLSLLTKSFAPNVDGQDAFALKYTTKESEYSLFHNSYVIANGQGLLGLSALGRFGTCLGKKCFYEHVLQLGGGLSTGGLFAELGWSFSLWILRVDFTKQWYLSPHRLIDWGYPFWMGVIWKF